MGMKGRTPVRRPIKTPPKIAGPQRPVSRPPVGATTLGFPPLPDVMPPRPRILFVGINPSIRSAEVGHHFAGFSNRFWRLLHESGLTPERLTFEQDGRLADWGYGLTNIIPRATVGVSDLRSEEFANGRATLLRKIQAAQPGVVVLVGVMIYRAVFPGARRTTVEKRMGLQDERLGGAPLFVVPNPSGRNATLSYEEMLEAYRGLKRFVDERAGG